jgi:hypothetical protein
MSGKGWFREGGPTREAHKTPKHTSSNKVVQHRLPKWSHIINNSGRQFFKSGQTLSKNSGQQSSNMWSNIVKTIVKHRQTRDQTSSNNVINHRQKGGQTSANTWSEIVKTSNHKSSKQVVTHRQTSGRKSSKTVVNHRQTQLCFLWAPQGRKSALPH